MKTNTEIIDGAIDLISRDGGWCQGAYCRDDRGRAATYLDPDMTSSFCIEGAIIQSASNWWYIPRGMLTEDDHTNYTYGESLADRIGFLLASDPHNTLPRYTNDDDSTSQEDAILYLKRARELANNGEL